MPDVLKATDLGSRHDERERTSGRSPQHGQTLPEVDPSATPAALRPHPVWMRQLLDTFARQRHVSETHALGLSPRSSGLDGRFTLLPGLRCLAASARCTAHTSGEFGAAGAGRCLWMGEHLLAQTIHFISSVAAYPR